MQKEMNLLLKLNGNESPIVIYERIEKVRQLLEKQGKNKLLPFIEAYSQVSLAFLDEIKRKREYNNFNSVLLFNAVFTKRYFDALKTYLQKRKTTQPWQKAFSLKNSSAFESMIDGVLIHVLYDLPLVLMHHPLTLHDFHLLNRVFYKAAPNMFSELALHQHDVYGIGGMIYSKYVSYILKKTIIKWRIQAYEESAHLTLDAKRLERNKKKLINLITLLHTDFHDGKGIFHIRKIIKQLENINLFRE